MGERTSYPARTFSWVDLQTDDLDAAKRFYGELLGWSYNDIPIGDDSVYSMAQVHGHNVATHLGHGDLRILVLPYPLEARPEAELRAIADEFYPQALARLGVST